MLKVAQRQYGLSGSLVSYCTQGPFHPLRKTCDVHAAFHKGLIHPLMYQKDITPVMWEMRHKERG